MFLIIIIINGWLYVSLKVVDKLVYIFFRRLERRIKKVEKCLYFFGLVGIRIIVGFLVGVGCIVRFFVGFVFVGSWKGFNEKYSLFCVF